MKQKNTFTKRLVITLLLLTSTTTLLQAETIFNVNQPIKRLKLSDNQVEEAIKNAAAELDWQVREESSNTLIATYRGDIYLAKIKISYQSSGYSIKYFDSTRMHYKEGDIHPTYNLLVEKLQNKIVQNLKTTTTTKDILNTPKQKITTLSSTEYAQNLKHKLDALKILLVDNVITQEEYDLKRKQIIDAY